jgi:hypothetical protein
MKRLCLSVIILLSSASHGFSQNSVRYTYDASGNRISRSIVLNTRQSQKKKTSQENGMYGDMLAEKKITISPNPTEGHLKVLITGKSDTDKCSLSVFSTSGQLVDTHPEIGECTEIDLSNHPNGYYILKININNETSSWKIIKK